MSSVDRVGDLDTATLYEAAGDDIAFGPGLGPMWPGARVVGTAFTVSCRPGDNLALHRAVERATPGDVLVIDAHAHLAGHWGEVLTVAALHRGVAGIVIDGGLRDVDALRGLGFPAFGVAPAVYRTTKHDPGLLGVPIVMRGVTVTPGDLIVGDTDGIVAIGAEQLDEVLERAHERVRHEVMVMQRLREGENTRHIYGLGNDT